MKQKLFIPQHRVGYQTSFLKKIDQILILMLLLYGDLEK
jgi:hypothetical protein